MPHEITFQAAGKTTEEVWPIDEIMDIVGKEVEAMELYDNIRPMDRSVKEHEDKNQHKAQQNP